MPSHTIDAALAVEASGAFPFTFSFVFGPRASLVADYGVSAALLTAATTALHFGSQNAEVSLGATATATASMGLAGLVDVPAEVVVDFGANFGKSWYADAKLAATISDTFPYTFPFVFGASPDVASRGQPLDAALGADVAADGAATRGAVGDADQSVVASTFALVISGGEHACDVASSVTATAAAGMSQRFAAAAGLGATADAAVGVAASLSLDADLCAQAAALSFVGWAALCDAALSAVADPGSDAALDAQANAVLEALTITLAESVRHQYADAPLTALAAFDASQFHDIVVDVVLAVSSGTTATVPMPTGFWDFFLR